MQLFTCAPLLGPVAQKQCPPGTYQPNEGATGCEACPAGSYCDEFGLAKAKECPAGFLCPEGSITGTSHYCKIGSISTQAGASTEESCVPCEAGKFCGEVGAIKETGECAAVSNSHTPREVALQLLLTSYNCLFIAFQ